MAATTLRNFGSKKGIVTPGFFMLGRRRSSRPTSNAMEEVVASIESRVTPAINETLLRPYTSEEIVQALKQMHPLKSPGPDESFSILIREAESTEHLQGIAVSRQASRISHLLFADDTLIFCQATVEAFSCIHNILLCFERALGLQINIHKSAVVFSKNVNDLERITLANILGIPMVTKHDKYLGLPTVLSQAGRAVLIKAVILTIPSYVMSCFRLPDSFLRDIESMAADFFWSGDQTTKIHWLAWDKLCQRKEEEDLAFDDSKKVI
ncbi:UNVERIFIED_CONTAM: hypothetical protein Slati_3698000 [Sesamum latifolium]|uniref:Reverse transcriptase domain-containing protein n=1 Tax=Sesamum latifolium TaxID=2727402 RepID=A0AAW2U2S0_9LAMI